jgi:hypothetical protein
MSDTLNVGRHIGTWGDGNYIAVVDANGTVTLNTVYDKANQQATVSLSRGEWERLVAWVEWQMKKDFKHCDSN